MNKELLKAFLKVAIYTHKADTKNSYYRQSGDDILPNRIDLSLGSTFTKAERKGRMTSERVVGEIRGQFKTTEASPLKKFKPFKISSKIFRQDEFPQLIGACDLAVSDEEGKAKIIEGVAAFYQVAKDTIQIFFVAGQATPNFFLAVCGLAADRITKEEGQRPSPDWILK